MFKLGTWMANTDIGEQFNNYCLDPALQSYCGVGFSPYFDDATAWELWTRCVFGLKTSPNGWIRMEMLGDEVTRDVMPHHQVIPFTLMSYIKPTWVPFL
jgi:hypothetical protein